MVIQTSTLKHRPLAFVFLSLLLFTHFIAKLFNYSTAISNTSECSLFMPIYIHMNVPYFIVLYRCISGAIIIGSTTS